MRGRPAVWFVAAALAAAGGCRSNFDPVEYELRAREIQARELRDALDGCRAHNQALEIELRALRGDACAFGPGVAPALVPPVYPIRALTLGRQTGGHPSDHGLGDDALVVLAEPRDAEGHAVKVPGSALLVQAIEITPEGLKRPLSSWEVPPAELRNTWRSGLLSCGYNLVLPWKLWPTAEKVRVVAQLRLPDGRVYEADKDVTVRPIPHPPPAPLPAPPSGPPILPPPAPLEGPPLPGSVLPVPTPEAKGSDGIWHSTPPLPLADILRPAALDPKPAER
jgi:hypothetical protein